MYFLSGGSLQVVTDVLGRLLPLVGSSSISTAYLVGITSVLAPLLEETLFRGFLMVSLSGFLHQYYQCSCICACTLQACKISDSVCFW
nr:hypothetical protein CFP56_46174 [Quercus suber]